jgi:hypothetical protein
MSHGRRLDPPAELPDRRAFLRAALGGAGAIVLAACGRGGPRAVPTEFARAVEPGVRLGLDVFEGGLEFVSGTEQRVTFVARERGGPSIDDAEGLRLWVGDGTTADGPFPLTWFAYRRAGRDDPQGFYRARAPIPEGTFTFLVTDGERFGTAVVRSQAAPTPGPAGRPAPSVATPTFGDPRGVANVCTRRPRCPMHEERLDRVLGRAPVVLLIGSPLLCTSRTCGPVLEEVLAVRRNAGHGATFIHAEPYRSGDATVLSRTARAFGIQSEPWTFVIDRAGTVRARFEGAVVAAEVARALSRV